MFTYVKENWSTSRKIKSTGADGSYDIMAFDSGMLTDGYVLRVDYGQSFSLDNDLRRAEIEKYTPMLLQAGYSPQKIVNSMRFNEVEKLFDAAEIAGKLQMEIIRKMQGMYDKAVEDDILDANSLEGIYIPLVV